MRGVLANSRLPQPFERASRAGGSKTDAAPARTCRSAVGLARNMPRHPADNSASGSDFLVERKNEKDPLAPVKPVKVVMDESEISLLQRFQDSGDIDAFARITRLYAGMVYGTCMRITGDREAAADATQDTFFALLKSASKVTGSLGGWRLPPRSKRP